MSEAQFITPLPTERGYEYWANRFEARQLQYQETAIPSLRQIIISLPEESIINCLGDTHVGSPEVDHNRLRLEVEAIVKRDNSFVILGGDLVDGYFFNPAQYKQAEQVPEQWMYINSMLRYLSEQKKILIAWGGDHDQWSMKMGLDPYQAFPQVYHAHYMKGVGFVTFHVGTQEYKFVCSHRAPGSTLNNKNYPQLRMARDYPGADAYMSFHNHNKAVSTQTVNGFGGIEELVSLIAPGGYKSSDDLGQKLGLPPKSPKGMYGVALTLKKDHKEIVSHWDILQANSGTA